MYAGQLQHASNCRAHILQAGSVCQCTVTLTGVLIESSLAPSDLHSAQCTLDVIWLLLIHFQRD